MVDILAGSLQASCRQPLEHSSTWSTWMCPAMPSQVTEKALPPHLLQVTDAEDAGAVTLIPIGCLDLQALSLLPGPT